MSDYVLGDRSTACRAVPGDGVIPLESLTGNLLEAGYAGLFDLELVGPRIAAEGAAAASAHAAERLSEILVKFGSLTMTCRRGSADATGPSWRERLT